MNSFDPPEALELGGISIHKKSTNLEFITDERGRQKAVVVPIKEWERLQRMKRKLEVLNGVADALEEVAAVQSGRQPKGQTLGELLNVD